MVFKADKEYMKVGFKEWDKFGANCVKYLKLTDKNLPDDLTKISDEEFEKILFAKVAKANKKIWSEKHKSADFVPCAENDLSFHMLPVNSLGDLF